MYVFKWLHKMPLTQNGTKNALIHLADEQKGTHHTKNTTGNVCMYNVILRRVPATIVVVEKQYYIF